MPPATKTTVLVVRIVAVVGLLGFLSMLGLVLGEHVIGWDQAQLELAVRTRTSTSTTVWRGVSAVGSFPLVVVVAALAAALADIRLRSRWAITTRVGVVLAVDLAVVSLVKMAVGRGRPTLATHLVAETDRSFPSGHVTVTSALLVLLTILVFRFEPTAAAKAAVVLCVVAAVAAMAWSRMYLGVHWPTDVIAGALLGMSIGCTADLVVVRFERRAALADVGREGTRRR